MIQRTIKKKYIICLVGLLMLIILLISCQNYENKDLTMIKQNFSLGVLAINTNKATYLPNETAEIEISILDNEGDVVCDADVILEITDAKGVKIILKTPEDIVVTESCRIKNITLKPDYYTKYKVNSLGTYLMKLTAVTNNGAWSIEDNFSVKDNVDFDVERKHWTRIYPFVNYIMNISIKANKDYKGLIRDYVPNSFDISGEGFIVTENADKKILSWDVDLNKDDEINLVYTIDYPDVSPEFYLLGKLDIGSWQEERYWQIANDAARTLDTVSLDAPVGDPGVVVGNTFQMTCSWTESGGGKPEVGTIYWENSTDNSVFSTIPATSLGGLTTEDTNPLSGTSKSTQYSITVTGETSGTYYVRCNVYGNNLADYVQSSSQQITVSDVAPELSSISYTPNNPNTSSDIIFNTTILDNNTASGLTVYCEWYNNSVYFGRDTMSNLDNNTIVNCTLVSGNTTKGQNWSVNMTGYDGTSNGTLVASSKVYINNTKPTLAAISYIPSTATIDDDVIFNTTITDDDKPDDGSLTVYCEWYNNSNYFATDTISSLDNGTVVNCTLAHGNTTQGENWSVNITAFDGDDNSTVVASEKITIIVYGNLSVTLNYPPDNHAVSQYSTFDINATINCTGPVGALCGDVYVYAKFNNSDIIPDTNINITDGAEPMFIVGGTSNPQTSPETLEAGEHFNVSWTVNLTASDGSYEVDVFANSSYGDNIVPNNHSTDSSICVGSCAGGNNPSISNIESIPDVTLIADSTKKINILFNVTDNDGTSDINENTANATVYKSGETSRYNYSCTKVSEQDNTIRFNCSIQMYFYDGAGTWNVNVSIQDNSETWAIDDTTRTFTVNTLDDVDIDDTTINWNGITASTDDVEGDNKGNQDYTIIQVTGYNANDGGSQTITAENFSVDIVTGATSGQDYLENGIPVTLTDAFINRGASETETMYTYVDVPPFLAGTFISTSDWQITFSTS